MLMDVLIEAAAAVAAAGLSALLGFMWRALLRTPLLMLAIGVALLAIMILLVGDFNRSSMQTEGSPAGMIMFVFYGIAVVGAGAVGLYFATHGLVILTEDTGLHVVLRALACFAAVGLFAAIATVQYHRHVKAKWEAKRAAERGADRAAGRPTYEAPASGMTPFEPHPRGPGAARDAAARMRYDECIAYRRESHRLETLKTCADELVRGWDESHAARRRFANMPDGAEFVGGIGDLYVAYAEATGDVSNGRSGVRGLLERVRARYPQEERTLARLKAAEESLGRR